MKKVASIEPRTRSTFSVSRRIKRALRGDEVSNRARMSVSTYIWWQRCGGMNNSGTSAEQNDRARATF